jgi:membrane associated rhomboid family serine protease
MSAGQSFFLGAPATKLLSIASVLSYVLIHSKNAHNAMSMDTSRVLQQGEWYRLLTAHISFGSTGEVVLGNLILAHFSKRFEREMGSRKFVLWLLQVYLVAISLLWTIIITLLSLSAGDEKEPNNLQYYYASGPYPTLGALLYLYYRFTPRLHPRFFGVLGFNISEKAIPYAFALPMVFYQGAATLIPTMCGSLAAWLAIHYPMDIVPNGVADMCSSIASPLVEAPPGMLAPRQQTPQQQQQPPRAAPRAAAAAPQPQQPQPPSQEAIDQLTSMGFDRETVVRALQQSNNSVERALDRLLSGS